MKILSFHPCIEADINIILAKKEMRNFSLLRVIQEADVIILPQILPEWLYWRCKENTSLLFPNYDVRFRYPGKIGQARLFKDSGIISPKTYIWKSVDEFKKGKGWASLPIPFVIKADRYHEAEGVFIIESEKDLKDMRRADEAVIDAIKSYDWKDTLEKALDTTVCGPQTITCAMIACKELGAKSAEILKYYNSYEKMGGEGPCDYSVGYLSAIFKR